MNKLVYWELPCTDTKVCSRFYAELFGWSAEETTDGYYMFSIEGGVGGGLGPVEEVPGWCIMMYFGVDDIPATLAKAATLGGTVVNEKADIGGDFGFWGSFTDPCGCRIGVWSES